MHGALVEDLVDKVLNSLTVDVVSELAKQLPIFTLCRLLGVPEERRDDMIRWSDMLICSDDPDFIDPAVAAYPAEKRRRLSFGHPASLDVFELGRELAQARRENMQNIYAKMNVRFNAELISKLRRVDLV